ncbi:MAG: hypothetical protein ACLP1X_13270 [Polyangiaceae bacterium]
MRRALLWKLRADAIAVAVDIAVGSGDGPEQRRPCGLRRLGYLRALPR